jgi:hypothetical protein
MRMTTNRDFYEFVFITITSTSRTLSVERDTGCDTVKAEKMTTQRNRQMLYIFKTDYAWFVSGLTQVWSERFEVFDGRLMRLYFVVELVDIISVAFDARSDTATTTRSCYQCYNNTQVSLCGA